jgi:hypothetical protein
MLVRACRKSVRIPFGRAHDREGMGMAVQLFSKVDYPLTTLVGLIENGQLGLPELQRPFVWERTQVRDLFDSLYKGYPAGLFLFWRTVVDHGTHTIGVDKKQAGPEKVIVDGQQRLTSIYAVMRGVPVVDEDFVHRRLQISFKPKTEQFEVANSATTKDPEWVTDISEIWTSGKGTFGFITDFISQLHTVREVAAQEETVLAANLNRLASIDSYQFTAIELGSGLDVEQVSDVFVRVNSKGTPLNQADFILTVLSVSWEEGRRELEAFARAAKQPALGPGPFNYFIQPGPDQLLRVCVGLGLRRAQLRAVYQLLRGRDENGDVSYEARQKQLDLLQSAQEKVLNLTHWAEFLKSLHQAGYRSKSMITSDNNVLYSYLIFLIGRCDYGLDYSTLRLLIARWFFMCTLTGRYTGTPESRVENDLHRLAGAADKNQFIAIVEQLISTRLTTDFWTVAVPDALETSSSYSPALFAYHASLNLLGAKVLFSQLTVSELLDPNVHAKKPNLDRHHLFPRGYLGKIGISGVPKVNQIANYALLEWPDNIAISAQAPEDYFPTLFASRTVPGEEKQMRFWHALPGGWEDMSYEAFLEERREMIAEVIKSGYEKLATGISPFHGEAPPPSAPPTVSELIAGQETGVIEFKSSARYSYTAGVPEAVVHEAVIKTVAAFLNSDGGTLAIGVSDDLEILGIQPDLDLKKQTIDGYTNWLSTLLVTSLGAPAALNTRIRIETEADKMVCLVDVYPSIKPVYASTHKGTGLFFARLNNTTRLLTIAEAVDYITSHWSKDH